MRVGDRVFVLDHPNGWRVVQFHWNPWIFRFGIVFNIPRLGIIRQVNVFGSYRVVFPEIRRDVFGNLRKLRWLDTGWRTKASNIVSMA